MTISSLYQKVKTLDTDKVAVEALTETTDKRIDVNREQMSKGIEGTGQIIGVYASRQYAAFKQAIGSQAPYGVVDLKLTKSFQEQIKSSVSNNTIITDSTDSKSVDLERKYGSDIFRLSVDYRIEYIKNDLRPTFNKKIEEKTGLKLK